MAGPVKWLDSGSTRSGSFVVFFFLSVNTGRVLCRGLGVVDSKKLAESLETCDLHGVPHYQMMCLWGFFVCSPGKSEAPFFTFC